MPKRRRIDEEWSAPAQKKRRLQFEHDLSLLSDELILKVMTYLPISDLAICQRFVYRPISNALLTSAGSVIVFNDLQATPNFGKRNITLVGSNHERCEYQA
jgi:hypothetical protein